MDNADVRPIAWFHPGAVSAEVQRAFTGLSRNASQATLSFELSGQVAQIFVEVGDTVKEGQLLAQLEDTDVRLDLTQRVSEQNEAKALLAEARQAHDRLATLREKNVVGQADLDQAVARLDSARSRLEVANSRVSQAHKRLGDTQLKAPYAGIIAQRHIENAQQVGALSPVLDIHGLDGQMEIKVKIPESIVGRLEIGSRHPVRIDGLGVAHPAAVLSEISGQSDASNSFTATLRFAHDGAYIRDGLTAVAELSYPSGAAPGQQGWLLVNGSYVVSGDNQVTAYRYQADSQTVHAMTLDVVSLRNEGVVVQGPIGSDDILASKGVAFLTSDQPVSLLEHDVKRFNP
ncbi:efflux RND transporter periplasmic adaptor subunit [Ferrimonas pelagia]|uniref:Efflux RND transporter periplasmic adaptor subunit n=2 Tax=Ferrimonas pelagia TaxID=1177826 RepID=A0ABP9EVI1_9GAMM